MSFQSVPKTKVSSTSGSVVLYNVVGIYKLYIYLVISIVFYIVIQTHSHTLYSCTYTLTTYTCSQQKDKCVISTLSREDVVCMCVCIINKVIHI